jgi:hypothetical protein
MLKPNVGRALSAVGAIVLLVSLALVWYHVERPTGLESSTGWESFPRLRLIVLAGALLTLVTALVPQNRWVLIARTVLGLVVAALVLRRIIDPPDISSPVLPQLGVYVALLGALAVALGGVVDTSRRMVPIMGLGRDPHRQLPPAPAAGRTGAPRPSRDTSPTGAAVRVPNQAQPRS